MNLSGPTRKAVFICVSILFCLLIAACTSKPKKEPRRFDITGKVVSVDKAKKQVVLAHQDIPGFMKAMTMDFTLKDEWAFNVLEPGDQISGQLVVDPDGAYIEGISIAKHASADADSSTSPVHEPEVGDSPPDFGFVNQDGRKVELRQFRGKPLLLTFIYTRCPLPDYCIRMSNNFAEVERNLKQSDPTLYSKLQLLSISIDPEFDQPQVLKQYAKSFAGQVDPKLEHWQFVTGKPADIRKTAEYFGLSYVKQNNQIVHSLRTALISGDGKIAALYEGNDWKPEDAIRDLKQLK